MRYLYENNPEIYAQDILSALNLTPPIDIFKVCESYDIKVNYENINSAEALLIVSQGKKNIIINDKKILYVPRQRFSIAHEVGHFFIPWHSNMCTCSNIGDFNSDNIEENQADIFASELLIPTNILHDKIQDKVITLDLIKELAQDFNVSLGAMTRKIIANTEDRVMALIYYGNGRKIVQAKSGSFELNLKSGIIKGSAAKELLHNRYSNENVKRILSCDIWFKENSDDFEIVEESLYQPKFSRVFTLLRVARHTDYIDAYFDM
ncbi:ImmA/IrrE family metallo-endopeptidase [Clostridium sp. SHJSY1]|uniref:ImmA/IrrE family metallo-endopeptidase n=1 Tax=Clostridium sp. SHJSY1 TaxID=2942483 RepID=UPI0028757F2C|nr:ImmA/IrrE family metallo-endopeptidase [Clostridium sp. SHJSY1]MDS0526069.1 ImmA/IrrE family metallo-endopeptidase [Clostridium sp. SHJSY1]